MYMCVCVCVHTHTHTPGISCPLVTLSIYVVMTFTNNVIYLIDITRKETSKAQVKLVGTQNWTSFLMILFEVNVLLCFEAFFLKIIDQVLALYFHYA